MKHYPTKDAAKMLGLSPRQLQRYCERGDIGEQVGRGYVIGADEIKAFARSPRGRSRSDSTE